MDKNSICNFVMKPVLTNKNVDDVCNVVRKPVGKNTDRMPDRRQQVTVIAQGILKLAAFLFHHRWHCTFDWAVKGVWEDTIHILTSQKRLEGKDKDPDMLLKVSKAYLAVMMKAIKESLRW